MRSSVALRSLVTRTTLRVVGIFLLLILSAGTGVYLFEYRTNPQEYRSLWDAIWWVFVTVFTVGYGDIKPITTWGRILAILVMVIGISMVSMITATISSIFVAKKIREDQGLESFNFENHLIICGWNKRGENFLDTIFELSKKEQPKVILVNDLPDTQIKTILDKYSKMEVKFVRGDYTSIAPLERANIKKAKAVIILPNLASFSPETADEKTILAVLNIKSLYPKVQVIAFILNPENESHARRAKADQVFISDQYSDYFIVSDIVQPGIAAVFNQIFNPRTESQITIQPIPSKLIGKTFKEVAEHFKNQQRALALGVISEVTGIKLSDFLSSDTSYLDAFIEKKLREAGKSLGEENRRLVHLNPGDDYIVQENEKIILLR